MRIDGCWHAVGSVLQGDGQRLRPVRHCGGCMGSPPHALLDDKVASGCTLQELSLLRGIADQLDGLIISLRGLGVVLGQEGHICRFLKLSHLCGDLHDQQRHASARAQIWCLAVAPDGKAIGVAPKRRAEPEELTSAVMAGPGAATAAAAAGLFFFPAIEMKLQRASRDQPSRASALTPKKNLAARALAPQPSRRSVPVTLRNCLGASWQRVRGLWRAVGE